MGHRGLAAAVGCDFGATWHFPRSESSERACDAGMRFATGVSMTLVAKVLALSALLGIGCAVTPSEPAIAEESGLAGGHERVASGVDAGKNHDGATATPNADQLDDAGAEDSCEDVISAWSDLVANAQTCEVDSDCHVSPVDCNAGLGICEVLVNSIFDAKHAADLEATMSALQCRSYPCECDKQAGSQCVDGACSWKPLCGSHEVFDGWADSLGRECRCDQHRGIVCMLCGEHWQGDQWADSNGCTCACTNDGEILCSC